LRASTFTAGRCITVAKIDRRLYTGNDPENDGKGSVI
jgi:hypothetical protein